MKRFEKEARAKRIIQFYIGQGCESKKTTCEHFAAEGVPKSTLYGIIRRFEVTRLTEYKSLVGRPRSVATPQVVQKIKQVFTDRPNTSVRNLASKMKIARSTLSHIKIKTLHLRARTKKIVPRYINNQETRAKSGARFVCDKARRKILIIDDETYVPADPEDVPGRKFYHCLDPIKVKFEDKVKPKTKFFKKYLVWQALDENGNISEPYITMGTINSDTYLKECIKKRLIPFIKRYNSVDSILFWPDLATSHYAGKVTEYLMQQNIDFVPKTKNPPNVPQARAIEQFWAICKQRYSKHNKMPKNLAGFKRIWKKISSEVAEKHGQALLVHGYRMLARIAKYGVKH